MAPMLLERDEKLLFKKDDVSTDEGAGTLYLTNKRVIIEATRQKKGFLKTKETMTTVADIRLIHIKDVKIREGPNANQGVLDVVLEDGGTRLYTSDVESLRKYLLTAKSLKGSFPITSLDQEPVAKKCKYCGSTVGPKLLKCPYCGAELEI